MKGYIFEGFILSQCERFPYKHSQKSMAHTLYWNINRTKLLPLVSAKVFQTPLQVFESSISESAGFT